MVAQILCLCCCAWFRKTEDKWNKHDCFHSVTGVATSKIVSWKCWVNVTLLCVVHLFRKPHIHAFHPCAYTCWCLCKQFMALKITSSLERMFCIAEPKWKQVNCGNCLQDTCALKHIGYTLGKLKDFSANLPSVEGLLMKCWGKVWYLRWNLWMGKMKSKNLGRRQLTCYSEGQLKLSYISFPCPKGKKTVKISQFWLSLPTHQKDYLSCGPSQPVLQKWVYSVLHFPLSIFSIGLHKKKTKTKNKLS